MRIWAQKWLELIINSDHKLLPLSYSEASNPKEYGGENSSNWVAEMTQWVMDLAAKKQISGVYPTWWKERIDSCKLYSYRPTPPPPTHTQRKRTFGKQAPGNRERTFWGAVLGTVFVSAPVRPSVGSYKNCVPHMWKRHWKLFIWGWGDGSECEVSYASMRIWDQSPANTEKCWTW